jgi:prolyl oligopeptidase
MTCPIDRRTFLLAAAATTGALAASPNVAQGAPALPRGPGARVEPVSETFFGETVVDPYRWMENAKDPDWAPFMKANADHARSILDRIGGRDALEKRTSELTGAFDAVNVVTRAGDRTFYQKRVAGTQSAALFVRDAAGDRALVDPNTMKQGDAHVSLDWWTPSRDGAHVVYGLSAAGSEDSVLHVMETATGKVLPERIPQTQYASPSWLPDGKGFFYNRLQGAAPGTTDYYLDSAMWLHRLGEDPAKDRLILKRGQAGGLPAEPTDFPYIYCNDSSPYVLAVMFGGVRRENPIWTARLNDLLAGRAVWTQGCTIEDEVVGFDLNGENLFMLTTKGAENGRVVRASAGSPAFAKAHTVVPESDRVIEAMGAAKDGLYVQFMDGGYSAVSRLGYGRGAKLEPIALPFEGTAALADYSQTRDGVLLRLMSWLEPVGFYDVDAKSGAVTDTGLAPRPPIDTSPYEAIRTFATARDGARVPLSIIKRKDAPLDGSSPALAEAYGSYQISQSPNFWTRGFAFLEAGGILATAHVRGGGEYGRRWWKAGQKLNKPNTWRDLIDCCEHLVKEGYTAPARLAINGGSAGGITMGMALAERPDLFCAVIPAVGVLNAMRAEFSQNGPPNIAEFGTVTEADGFKGLKAMDALHHIKDGQRYPAVLLTHGMTDPRVEPWHSGKFVARLRAADTTGGPFLLRVTFDAGHGLGSTRSQLDAEWADIFAFVLWRAGSPRHQLT